jgi:hypothetical protein
MTDAHWTRHHFRKKRLTQYVGRGEVYSWLRAYHTEVSEMLARGELSWAMLSVEIQRAGVRGRWGESPTPKAAARVWRRVSRDVEAAAAAAVPKRKYPSRMSVDWRPEVVSQPPAKSAQDIIVIPPPPSKPAASSPSEPIAGRFMDPEGLPPAARQMLVELEEQFRRADRSLGPPPTRRKDNNG